MRIEKCYLYLHYTRFAVDLIFYLLLLLLFFNQNERDPFVCCLDIALFDERDIFFNKERFFSSLNIYYT